MFSQVIFFYLIIFLNQRLARADFEIREYACDTQAELDEIKELDLKRFLMNKNDIYLILKSKIIFFKRPYLDNQSFVISQPFYQLNEEDANFKETIAGYLHNVTYVGEELTEDATNELYFDHFNQTKIGKVKLLKFEKVLGERNSEDDLKIADLIAQNVKIDKFHSKCVLNAIFIGQNIKVPLAYCPEDKKEFSKSFTHYLNSFNSKQVKKFDLSVCTFRIDAYNQILYSETILDYRN